MKRKEIKKALPYGYRKILATKTGYSPAYIDSWFREENSNPKIEVEVMDYLSELIERKKTVEERFNKIKEYVAACIF